MPTIKLENIPILSPVEQGSADTAASNDPRDRAEMFETHLKRAQTQQSQGEDTKADSRPAEPPAAPTQAAEDDSREDRRNSGDPPAQNMGGNAPPAAEAPESAKVAHIAEPETTDEVANAHVEISNVEISNVEITDVETAEDNRNDRPTENVEGPAEGSAEGDAVIGRRQQHQTIDAGVELDTLPQGVAPPESVARDVPPADPPPETATQRAGAAAVVQAEDEAAETQSAEKAEAKSGPKVETGNKLTKQAALPENQQTPAAKPRQSEPLEDSRAVAEHRLGEEPEAGSTAPVRSVSPTGETEGRSADPAQAGETAAAALPGQRANPQADGRPQPDAQPDAQAEVPPPETPSPAAPKPAEAAVATDRQPQGEAQAEAPSPQQSGEQASGQAEQAAAAVPALPIPHDSAQRQTDSDAEPADRAAKAVAADRSANLADAPARDNGEPPARAGAPASTPADTEADQAGRARFVERVARAFQSMRNRGGTVRLRLSPPELGAVRLEISLHRGAMSARVEADNPTARNLLLDNLPALRDRLAQQDIKIEQFNVELTDHSSSGLPEQTADQARSQNRGGRQPATQGNSEPDANTENLTGGDVINRPGEGTQLNVVI